METSLIAKLVALFSLLVFIGAGVVIFVIMLSFALGGAPFAPSPVLVRKRMMELAGVRKGETVYDLGCGDGRLLIEASKKYGARSVGIEVSPPVYWLARFRIWLSGAEVRLIRQDVMHADFSDADVVFCYLLPGHMRKLESSFRRLKKGSRIVTHQFEIPGWSPAERSEVDSPSYTATVLKYEV
jgi:SAM-dependent methyltransferase